MFAKIAITLAALVAGVMSTPIQYGSGSALGQYSDLSGDV